MCSNTHKHLKLPNTLNYCQQFLTKYGCHTLKRGYTKPAVFVSSFSKAKGKIQKNTVNHKGVCEPWAHSAKGTSSFVYQVSKPVDQNQNWQMCRNQNISPIVLIQIFQSIVYPSDLLLFIWSGSLADESGRWYNRCPAVEVTPQHGLHTLSIRPAWRVSKWTADRARSHTYVADKFQIKHYFRKQI